ncbi:MAG: hypothetical protein Q6K99_07245 [Thermostichales cyanobacterium BF4_bins_65]
MDFADGCLILDIDHYRRVKDPLPLYASYFSRLDVVLRGSYIIGVGTEANSFRKIIAANRSKFVDFVNRQAADLPRREHVAVVFIHKGDDVDIRVFSFSELAELIATLDDRYVIGLLGYLLKIVSPYCRYPSSTFCLGFIGSQEPEDKIEDIIYFFLANLDEYEQPDCEQGLGDVLTPI